MKYDTVFVRRILITLANGILQSGFFSPLKIMQFRIFFRTFCLFYSLCFFDFLVFWRSFVSFYLSHSLYLCIHIPVILSTRLIYYPSFPLPISSSTRLTLYPSHPLPVSSSTRPTLDLPQNPCAFTHLLRAMILFFRKNFPCFSRHLSC